MKNKRTPEVRFLEFSGDWEERKLKDIVNLLKDGTHGTHKDGKDAFLLSAKNIKNGQIVINELTDRKISSDDYNSIFKNYKLMDQDLLITIVGTIGQTALYTQTTSKLAFQRSVAIIRGNKDINQNFLKSTVDSNYVQKQLKQSASMSAQAGVYLGDLEKLTISIPELSEQIKIGKFFKQLDETITLHQRELTTLKQTKQGFLQKMFPKEGETLPEIRFPGFTGGWEQRKFENMLDENEGIRRGPFGSALKKEYFVNESDYVVYEQQNAIYNNYETRYNITKEKFDELKKFKLEEGDFIMSGAGTIGRISRVPKGIKQGVFNQALIRFKIDTNLTDSEYFLQLIRSENMQRKLTGANPGSAITNLVPMSEVKKWDVVVPSLKEQTKIGNFLKQLDETIALHQRELDALKETKKAFLQKMFA